MALIEGYFDGVCEPQNPGGYAAWGALVKVDGERVWEEGGYCGVGPAMSNNVAEYSAVIAVLKHIAPIRGSVVVRGDSKLVVMQLMGRWRIHGGLYVPFYNEAMALLDKEREARQGNIKLVWIPRDQNGECDVLSKGVLHAMGVQFRIQPEEAHA